MEDKRRLLLSDFGFKLKGFKPKPKYTALQREAQTAALEWDLIEALDITGTVSKEMVLGSTFLSHQYDEGKLLTESYYVKNGVNQIQWYMDQFKLRDSYVEKTWLKNNQ
jgi:hypothetical protein